MLYKKLLLGIAFSSGSSAYVRRIQDLLCKELFSRIKSAE